MKRIISTLIAASGIALGIAVLPTTAAPAQAADYAYCYMSITNDMWCYRYNCTAAEEFSGCYEGWVIVDWIWYT